MEGCRGVGSGSRREGEGGWIGGSLGRGLGDACGTSSLGRGGWLRREESPSLGLIMSLRGDELGCMGWCLPLLASTGSDVLDALRAF